MACKVAKDKQWYVFPLPRSHYTPSTFSAIHIKLTFRLIALAILIQQSV